MRLLCLPVWLPVWLPVAAALSALGPLPSAAHEFWIAPEEYSLAPGGELRADLRVGQRFEGTSAPYIPMNFTRFDVATGGDDAPRPVPGRIGDRPALQMEVDEPGLATILHVTRDYELVWESWEAFTAFLDHKDAAWVVAADAERGRHPRDGVVEGYSRYAKALVAVGEGRGEDRAHGLLTEIVALENPYTGELSDGLDVRLLYDDAPRPDAQVGIFARGPEGAVETRTVRTDAAGMATIPVAPGTEYLLDAVLLRVPTPDLAMSFGAEWESLWASLTFRTPD